MRWANAVSARRAQRSASLPPLRTPELGPHATSRQQHWNHTSTHRGNFVVASNSTTRMLTACDLSA